MTQPSEPPPAPEVVADQARNGEADPSPVEGASVPARRRWQVWRSPVDQPGYARPALLAIAAAAAILWVWGIATRPTMSYYTMGVRSMTESWHNFFYDASDPGGYLTEDKLPGAYWIQALSARLFGWHDWAVLLPSVLAALIALLVLYRVVRRWAGPPAGLLAAAAFALTPAITGLARINIPDGFLILCWVCAVDAFWRYLQSDRLPPLVWSAVFLALGFNVKMLQVGFVIPALAVTLLVAGKGSFGHRLGRGAIYGVATLALSSLWILAVLATPADTRPLIATSPGNTPVELVFSYNGLGRLSSDSSPFGGLPGGGGPGAGAASLPQGIPGGSGPPGFGGTDPTGITHLLGADFADQFAWFLPLALAGLGLGLAVAGRRPRTDEARAGYLLFGLWFVVAFLAMSFGTGTHGYYTASVAVPLAGLAGAGTALGWQRLRTRAAGWWVLPAATVATAAWIALTVTRADVARWVVPIAVLSTVIGVVLVLVLVLARPGSSARPVFVLGAALIAAGLVVAPLAWTVAGVGKEPAFFDTINPMIRPVSASRGGGLPFAAPGPSPSTAEPNRQPGAPTTMAPPASLPPGVTIPAGLPPLPGGTFPPGFTPPAGFPPGGFPGGQLPPGVSVPGGGVPGAPTPGASIPRAPNPGAGSAPASAGDAPAASLGALGSVFGGPAQNADAMGPLVDWFRRQRGSERFLYASEGAMATAPVIIATGEPILPMGGLNVNDPPDAAQLADLVRSGQLRFVVLGGAASPFGGGDHGRGDWVRAHCRVVDPTSLPQDATSRSIAPNVYDCKGA